MGTQPSNLEIWTEVVLGRLVWCARGKTGHPWLIMTDRVDRFREMIRGL